MSSDRGLSILIHGPAGAGKSTAASTGPWPILNLDVENSARFLSGLRRVYWNPMEEAMPVYDGTWDMCVVRVEYWEIAEKAYEYIRPGNHPFRTVMVDSISELQVKAMENVNGRNQMQIQHWGRLGQKMGGTLRDLRDLVGNGKSDLELMVLISTSKEIEDPNNPGEPVWKPYLQGAIAQQVPYLFDITGYLYSVPEANQQTGEVFDRRYLFTGKHPKYEAKNRVRGFPATLADPNLSVMLDMIFGPNPNYTEQVEQTIVQDQVQTTVPDNTPPSEPSTTEQQYAPPVPEDYSNLAATDDAPPVP